MDHDDASAIEQLWADYKATAGSMLEKSPLIIAQAFTPTEFDWRVTTLGGKPLFGSSLLDD